MALTIKMKKAEAKKLRKLAEEIDESMFPIAEEVTCMDYDDYKFLIDLVSCFAAIEMNQINENGDEWGNMEMSKAWRDMVVERLHSIIKANPEDVVSEMEWVERWRKVREHAAVMEKRGSE